MLYLLSPASSLSAGRFNYRRVLYILLMSVMVFMAHAATARVILLLYIALMAYLTRLRASLDGDLRCLSVVSSLGRRL